MSKPNNIDENLLAKYLDGQANKHDLEALEAWLNADTANTLELDRYRKIWNLNSKSSIDFEPDVTLAWQKVQKRINAESQITPLITKQNPFLRNFSIAASVALLVSFGIYFYFFKERAINYQSIVSQNNSVEKMLSDSSKVFLNHYSKLEFPDQFSRSERRVKLKGEAFFDIKPNTEKPFNIEVDKLNIKVLGTSFNVEEDSLHISIIVKSGKVEVAKSASEKEILTAGEGVDYDKIKKSFSRKNNSDPNEFAYYNKVFTFKNTSLKQVTQMLSKGYHAKVTVGSQELSELAITTKFENESLPDALQIIAETLQLKLKIENNSYVFVKNNVAQ
jgi:transmembrane sensor